MQNSEPMNKNRMVGGIRADEPALYGEVQHYTTPVSYMRRPHGAKVIASYPGRSHEGFGIGGELEHIGATAAVTQR